MCAKTEGQWHFRTCPGRNGGHAMCVTSGNKSVTLGKPRSFMAALPKLQ